MKLRTALFLLPLITFVGCETTAPTKRYFISSYRGMENQPGVLGGSAMVRVGDAKSLQKYTKVIIEDVRVIPAKKTSPDQKVATREESRILADKFEAVLRRELGNHYELTTRRGSNTLAVRAALTELQPSNPALFALNYAPYVGIAMSGVKVATGNTPGAGATSFEAEVLDSLSRRQLYAILDRSQGTKIQFTGLDKWGHSESAMRIWSRKIRTGIQANTKTLTTSTIKKSSPAKKS